MGCLTELIAQQKTATSRRPCWQPSCTKWGRYLAITVLYRQKPRKPAKKAAASGAMLRCRVAGARRVMIATSLPFRLFALLSVRRTADYMAILKSAV